jgi:hypothetical protein
VWWKFGRGMWDSCERVEMELEGVRWAIDVEVWVWFSGSSAKYSLRLRCKGYFCSSCNQYSLVIYLYCFFLFCLFFIRNSMHPTSPHFTMTQLVGLATNQIASEKPLDLSYTSNKRIDPFPFGAEVPCYLDSTHVLRLWSSLFLKTSELITLN